MSGYLEFADLNLADLNERGLTKLLFTRRQTIHLKNVLRLASEEPPELKQFLQESGLSWPRYLRQITHRLRAVLKGERRAPVLDADTLHSIRQPDSLELARKLKLRCLASVDFDRTLTDKGFLDYYRSQLAPMRPELQPWVVSAHGDKSVLEKFVQRHRLEIRSSRLLATGSLAAKRRALFELSSKTDRSLMFHYDDEEPFCRLAQLFGYHAYRVVRSSTPRARSTVEPLLLS
ncbi:hypothetical protein DYH09_29060 [bacterium CPR1]|nr:hypothetical protein [bacterium CPR1]